MKGRSLVNADAAFGDRHLDPPGRRHFHPGLEPLLAVVLHAHQHRCVNGFAVAVQRRDRDAVGVVVGRNLVPHLRERTPRLIHLEAEFEAGTELDNPGRAKGLQADDVIAFKTADGRFGLFKVVEIVDGNNDGNFDGIQDGIEIEVKVTK